MSSASFIVRFVTGTEYRRRKGTGSQEGSEALPPVQRGSVCPSLCHHQTLQVIVLLRWFAQFSDLSAPFSTRRGPFPGGTP